LQDYLNKIIDIRYITPEEKDIDKNMVWVGRNAGYSALKSFLTAINLLGKNTSSPKDSWE